MMPGTALTRPETGAGRRWAGPLLVAVAVIALACAVPVLAPYASNQNQYLLPVVGPTVPALASDWMLTTVDPYPFFTSVSSAMFSIAGEAGFVVAAIGAALLAWTALYLLSRDLLGGRRGPALVAVVAVAVSQLLPLVPNMFGGLANQYILEQPMFYQPAAAGALVLLAAVLALRSRLPGTQLRRAHRWGAVALAGLGCALHPTYLVVVALLLFCALVIDLFSARRSLRLLLGYAGLVAGFAAVTLLLNPAVFDLAAGDPALNARFAFERIPQHTLMSQWGIWTWRYAALVVLAALLWWRAARWLARWMLLSITLAVGLAASVEATRNTSLALAFPARASVVLVPLAFAAVMSFGVRWVLSTRAGGWLQRPWVPAGATAAAVVLGLVGLGQTLDLQRNPKTDEVTALVADVQPVGVGLVPLGRADNVRLNAGAAIYVDRKSPPYASDDLAQWFRRVDAATAAQSDEAAYCALVAGEAIRWVVLPAGVSPPQCLSDWQLQGTSPGFSVLADPR